MTPPSQINLTLATVTHRLDQLTRPTFDRATVEELLAEIFRLRSEEHRNQIAKELAWRDNKIDELTEANNQLGDDAEEYADQLRYLQCRVEELEQTNRQLADHLAQAVVAKGIPIQVPAEYAEVKNQIERMSTRPITGLPDEDGLRRQNVPLPAWAGAGGPQAGQLALLPSEQVVNALIAERNAAAMGMQSKPGRVLKQIRDRG